jgi:four helix bundle protein
VVVDLLCDDGMTPEELKRRSKKFAVSVFTFSRTLPTDPATLVIVRQLVKSGTSTAANYRSACRAKSKPDFVSKMATAEEEADETLFWLELLVESETVAKAAVLPLMDEANELTRIFVASIKTARGFSR